MTLPDISTSAGSTIDGSQLDSVSGASGYVPADFASNDSAISQMRSEIQQKTQNFQSLKSALNSNNLAGATQAYASFQQVIQNASSAAGGQSPFGSNSPIGNDFQAIGAALKSGDVTAAKRAFSAFKTDIKIAGRAARASRQPVARENTLAGGPNSTTAGSTAVSLMVGGNLNTTA